MRNHKVSRRNDKPLGENDEQSYEGIPIRESLNLTRRNNHPSHEGMIDTQEGIIKHREEGMMKFREKMMNSPEEGMMKHDK